MPVFPNWSAQVCTITEHQPESAAEQLIFILSKCHCSKSNTFGFCFVDFYIAAYLIPCTDASEFLILTPNANSGADTDITEGLLLAVQGVPPAFTLIFHLVNRIQKKNQNHNGFVQPAENTVPEALPQSHTDQTLSLTDPALSSSWSEWGMMSSMTHDVLQHRLTHGLTDTFKVGNIYLFFRYWIVSKNFSIIYIVTSVISEVSCLHQHHGSFCFSRTTVALLKSGGIL